MIRLLFILILFVAAVCSGHISYKDPLAISHLAPTAATVLAVLVSVSLAIFSILAIAYDPKTLDTKKKKRIKKVINSEDNTILDQNSFIFYVLFISLGLCLVCTFTLPSDTTQSITFFHRLLSAISGFFATFSFLLTALLPNTLIGIIRRNRNI